MTGPLLAASVGVFREGRVLLAERLTGAARGLFSFPGGRVEPGERLADTALRELREEVGIEARLAGFVDHVELVERDHDGVVTFHAVVCAYAGHWLAGEPRSGPEAGRIVWVRPDEVSDLPTTAGLPGIVARAARIVAAV